MLSSQSTQTNSTSTPCKRSGCSNTCSDYVTYRRSALKSKYDGSSLCAGCKQLCCYVDATGTLCTNSTRKPGLCPTHDKLLNQLAEYKKWKKAIQFHKTHVYVGSHWEKADADGPIDIYHYMELSNYNKLIQSGKQIDWANFYEYDTEIWIYDDLWSYAGPNAVERISQMDYPDDFEEKCKLKLLCKTN